MRDVPFYNDDDEDEIGDLRDDGYASRNDWLEDMRKLMDPDKESDVWDDEE